MTKVGLTKLLSIFSDLRNKKLSDQMFNILISSLWRDHILLRHEKAITYKDNVETGYQRNDFGNTILYGFAEGQNNMIEGERSAAFGQGNNTKSFLEIILGANALIPEGQNATEWIPTDMLLTLGNGPDPEHRSNVFVIYKNGLIRFEVIPEVWVVDHYEKILSIGDIPEPDTITEETENYTGEGKHTHKLELPTKGITEIVKTILDNNHESYLIENSANTEETVVSSWSVIPYSEQVGEFKAVVMVRNKALNTIITVMSILSFDYSDPVKVSHQNSMLTDIGITLTVGVNSGTNKLYATVSGMTEDNKRIHLCFERCVLSQREYTISAAGDFELNGSALPSAIVAMSSPEFDFNLSLNAVLKAEGLLNAASDFGLNGTAELVQANTITEVKFGAYYNKQALVDSRNLANTGWHVPTNAEIIAMTNSLGAWSTAGGKLKETGTTFWNTPNTGASNLVGFNLRGAGVVGSSGTCTWLKEQGFIWAIDGTTALRCDYNSEARAVPGVSNFCLTVRLVKDSTSLLNGETGTYTGNDGKVYRTICIANKEWMADNLKETKWRDGTAIEQVLNNAWSVKTYGIVTYYNNDINNA